MQDEKKTIEAYVANHRKKTSWLRLVICLALAVTLFTTYALIRPALSREICCTLPQHTHTVSCYTQVDGTEVLTCGMAEHTHTEECLSSVKLLRDGTSSQTTPLSAGTVDISLLYGDEQPQSAHPDGVSYYTHSTMSGYIRLEPHNLEEDPTDLLVTLSVPKQYVEKDSLHIPPFSTNSSDTKYEILPVQEDSDSYSICIRFTVYDKTQTLVLPFVLSFLDDVVPDNYCLPVTAQTSLGSATISPSIYKPMYKNWAITKFVNSNKLDAFSRDHAEAVVTPQEPDGNPYLDDRTYINFAFIVNSFTGPNCNLNDFRDASQVTLTDALPQYVDKDGVTCIAAFDAEKNPGWVLNSDEATVSKTYSGTNSRDVLEQIYNDQLHLRFPGLPLTPQQDGTLEAELTNSVQLTAVPSGEAPGETHPSAEDSLLFRLTDDPSAQGSFTKGALKGNIYDVDVYKTNPYPWSIALTNNGTNPLQHITIQDRKITENGNVVLEGLDEALKFVRIESNASLSSLPQGKTFADIVEKVTAYYADGTIQDYPITQLDAVGNFTVTFDEAKICAGYDVIFRDDYQMQTGEKASFIAYTVYRDPSGTHIPDGEAKITYKNTARAVNIYQKDDQSVFSYAVASHSYDMLPSTENLSLYKLTLCNDGTETFLGRGGNHVGDYFLYQLTLYGSLLEPEVKEYQDLRIVDLLPDGIGYDSIYLLQGGAFLDGGTQYQPEIVENYHNSGRTAVIFHMNANNLRLALKESSSHFVSLYFWVQIQENARTGTVRNDAYVVGDNLDEYRGSATKSADKYDLNNNGRTDDQVAYGSSDATIIAAQSIFAEKFIAPAGSESWNKQGLSLKTGDSFDYLLKVTNETSASHTGLTVYDTLPRPGDQNILGNASRGSEFAVTLRQAITPPEGYTVLYTTSSDVYEKPMDEMIAADIWTDTISDYASVTAFKIVAQEGTVLAGHSTLQVRIPAQTPSQLDAASMEILHQKPDYDQSTGTASHLDAVNSFGFKTDLAPSVKESNAVWARLPFAGFWVKKTNALSGIGVPGAEFTLSDAQGSTISAAVSDDQGLLHFRDLTEGDYTLTETKVPDGYKDVHLSVTVTITQSAVTGEYTVSLSGTHAGTGTSDDPLCIENQTSYELPDTGGAGSAVFYLLGAALVLSAAALAVTRQRFRRKTA